MEPRSASPRRGCVPWHGLLLSASILALWAPLVTAQLTIEPVPPNAAEGQNVVLKAHNQPPNAELYRWYKGETTDESHRLGAFSANSKQSTPGPAYSGRETIQEDGSLFFQNVTVNDTGVYTLDILDRDFASKRASGQFQVFAKLPKPFITSNNSSPMEGEDSVALTCDPETENTNYQWWINGQSLPNDTRLHLSPDNRILTLSHVTRNDMGPYECGTWNLVSDNRSDPFTLNVSYGPDIPIISPPSSYVGQGTNLSLSCHTASNPPAQYSWLFNERPQSSTPALFIPSITVNHSGSYACFAYNSVTGLNSTTVKNITVLEPVTQPSIQASNTTVTEQQSVVLTCHSTDPGITIRWLFNEQSLPLTTRTKLSKDNSTLSIDPVRREDSGEYRCEVSNPVSSRKSNPLRLDVNYDPTQSSSDLSPGAIAGIVVGVVAGVALIAALAYFLYSRKTGGASNQRDLTEHKPSASSHSPEISRDDAPNEMDEVSYTSLKFNAAQPKNSTPVPPTSVATETVYSEVKKK
ncbi:carcinoembryonic antigen-related cell adhesion molecule 1 isoform X1 [Dipodomys spectabilis]|uniref:carcinoembryonic antigen-related cell adhesion molecule 1 isoform X1 n=1 Tax=Dipodomys spectabilis TaxID=105255 RepID=UPI001C540D0F|nr:carcinoembryonic antigen-related cell adhesion molecule 1 isoform X1 [Dipodomys spectabilis]XP_042524055.1 carcinoembryonic antigen-related cell adhesion molecule 1 isoform X1 [Dipodomys spectabilis]